MKRRVLMVAGALVFAALHYEVVVAAEPVLVTAENFPRAESDLYFGGIVKEGGFGKFTHRREPAAIDKQTVIRLNRDTLYSARSF